MLTEPITVRNAYCFVYSISEVRHLNLNKDGALDRIIRTIALWNCCQRCSPYPASQSLPARWSLCEGNTMRAAQTPQKGIALESHTSAEWPLLVWWRLARSQRTPTENWKDSELRRRAEPPQMAAYCFHHLYDWIFSAGGADIDWWTRITVVWTGKRKREMTRGLTFCFSWTVQLMTGICRIICSLSRTTLQVFNLNFEENKSCDELWCMDIWIWITAWKWNHRNC